MKDVEYILRQGDVGLFKVDAFPQNVHFTKDELAKTAKLALGEISHHEHRFEDPSKVELFQASGYPGITFINVLSETCLIHGLEIGYNGRTTDEDYHSELRVPKGSYISGIFQETDWIGRTVRRVVD